MLKWGGRPLTLPCAAAAATAEAPVRRPSARVAGRLGRGRREEHASVSRPRELPCAAAAGGVKEHMQRPPARAAVRVGGGGRRYKTCAAAAPARGNALRRPPPPMSKLDAHPFQLQCLSAAAAAR